MSSRKSAYSPEAWERHKARERARYAEKRADPEWRARHSKRTQTYAASKRRFLMAVKTTAGCIDCGATEGRLDFDHRPGTAKAFNLGRPRCSWSRLLAELEKCDVRCAACHSRRHGVDRGGLNHSEAA